MQAGRACGLPSGNTSYLCSVDTLLTGQPYWFVLASAGSSLALHSYIYLNIFTVRQPWRFTKACSASMCGVFRELSLHEYEVLSRTALQFVQPPICLSDRVNACAVPYPDIGSQARHCIAECARRAFHIGCAVENDENLGGGRSRAKRCSLTRA